jgi:hypothetical protein
MSRLRELNETVTSVDSEAKAAELITIWTPEQAKFLDGQGTGVQAGVRNCSLIASFIVAFYTFRKVKYGAFVTGDGKPPKKAETFDLRKVLTKDPQVTVVMAGGHDFAIVREGNLYGLYQAWEGKFHVFPKLNEDDESHNIFGMGDDTIKLINDEVAYIARMVNTPDGAPPSDGAVGTPGSFDLKIF